MRSLAHVPSSHMQQPQQAVSASTLPVTSSKAEGGRGGQSAGVGISLKRTGVSQPDIQTLPHHSRRDVIRSIFGATVKDNLVEFSDSLSWTDSHTQPPAAPGEEPCFSVRGLMTNQNARCKKTHFLLFVNGRPVDCSGLKSAVESVYAGLHAKAGAFWVFLDVRMPCQHVDVNVHPTKSEVMFLHEAELVDLVRGAVEGALEECQGTRTLAKDATADATAPLGSFPCFSAHQIVA